MASCGSLSFSRCPFPASSVGQYSKPAQGQPGKPVQSIGQPHNLFTVLICCTSRSESKLQEEVLPNSRVCHSANLLAVRDTQALCCTYLPSTLRIATDVRTLISLTVRHSSSFVPPCVYEDGLNACAYVAAVSPTKTSACSRISRQCEHDPRPSWLIGRCTPRLASCRLVVIVVLPRSASYASLPTAMCLATSIVELSYLPSIL